MLHATSLVGFGSGSKSGGIQFVGSTSLSAGAGSTTGSVTLSLQFLTDGIATAAAPGDFVLGLFSVGTYDGTSSRVLVISDTSDVQYTLVGSQLLYNDAADYKAYLRLAYKFITTDVDIKFGPTGSASDPGIRGAYVFRGVNTVTPLDVTPTTNLGTIRPNPPSITPVTPGAVIVAAGAVGHFGINDPFSAPTDLIGFKSVWAADAYELTLGIGYKDDWTSGAFDPAQFVNGLSSTGYKTAAMTVALRPA